MEPCRDSRIFPENTLTAPQDEAILDNYDLLGCYKGSYAFLTTGTCHYWDQIPGSMPFKVRCVIELSEIPEKLLYNRSNGE